MIEIENEKQNRFWNKKGKEKQEQKKISFKFIYKSIKQTKNGGKLQHL